MGNFQHYQYSRLPLSIVICKSFKTTWNFCSNFSIFITRVKRRLMADPCGLGLSSIAQMARDCVHNNISCLDLSARTWALQACDVQNLDQCVRSSSYLKEINVDLYYWALVFTWTVSLAIWAMNLGQGHTVLPLFTSFDQCNEITVVI